MQHLLTCHTTIPHLPLPPTPSSPPSHTACLQGHPSTHTFLDMYRPQPMRDAYFGWQLPASSEWWYTLVVSSSISAPGRVLKSMNKSDRKNLPPGGIGPSPAFGPSPSHHWLPLLLLPLIYFSHRFSIMFCSGLKHLTLASAARPAAPGAPIRLRVAVHPRCMHPRLGN